MYRRPLTHEVLARLREPRRFIQAIVGPRQVGKTTLALQVLEDLERPHLYAAADEPLVDDVAWMRTQWTRARQLAAESATGAVLVLDEVQKLAQWSATVKRLWDEDTRAGVPLHVVLLGSAPLLVHRGLTESLAGRFEVLPATHWQFPEMRAAFDWDVDRFLYFGGYPGAAALTGAHGRWTRYIRDALIETTVSRDIFLMTRVDKPALLQRLFLSACEYSGQVLSYQKMLGQLQDAGNTTTLAHYLDLLAGAGLVAGLQKYAGQHVRRRGSSPKLQVLNTGLLTATTGPGFAKARRDTEYWGRVVESAVGAALLATAATGECTVTYWRERNREVDFIVEREGRLLAIEVKSGRPRGTRPGLDAFTAAFPDATPLLVGRGGVPLEEFLTTPVRDWF